MHGLMRGKRAKPSNLLYQKTLSMNDNCRIFLDMLYFLCHQGFEHFEKGIDFSNGIV